MADRVRIKICGLMRRQDVEAVDRAGADYVGVILSAGFTRSVEPSLAGDLVRGVSATPVAVLVDESPDGAEVRATALGAKVLQLHGEESPDTVREVATRGDWRLWKSIRVWRPDDVPRAVERYGALVDGLLLEGFREGVVGGGGVRLDLDALMTVRAEIPSGLEVVLAGGLRPENVEGAVARFRPAVVDVSSGVEREPGRKDPDLVRRFVEAARRTPPIR
jgi:phosphoribosylanthranilate isomerase